MVSFWGPVMDWLTSLLFGSKTLAFTAVFLVAMALPLGLVTAAAVLSGQAGRETLVKNFARFGYAVIPLDLAGHIAHNLFHLLAEGKSVFYNTAAIFGYQVTGPLGLVPTGAIQLLQYVTVGLGLAGSILAAYQIVRRSQGGRLSLGVLWPHLAVIALFGIVNLYLFTLPMAHRV